MPVYQEITERNCNRLVQDVERIHRIVAIPQNRVIPVQVRVRKTQHCYDPEPDVHRAKDAIEHILPLVERNEIELPYRVKNKSCQYRQPERSFSHIRQVGPDAGMGCQDEAAAEQQERSGELRPISQQVVRVGLPERAQCAFAERERKEAQENSIAHPQLFQEAVQRGVPGTS